MTKHEARAALAITIAKDALNCYLKEVQFMPWIDEVVCGSSMYIRNKPFFKSDDIADAHVESMKSIKHFYPRLNAVIVPKRTTSYIYVDYVI